MGTVPETLHAFGPSTLVVRAVDAVLTTLGRSALGACPDVASAVDAAVPGASAAVRSNAAALALDPTAAGILAKGAAIDGADRHLARTATPDATLDLQGQDAVLKLVALASLDRATGGLATLPSGRALLTVWAAVDVALPLHGGDVARLLEHHRGTAAIRWVALAGESALDGVDGALRALLPAAQAEVDGCAGRVDALAQALAPFVPGLLATADGAAERIALQTDRLPVYKWLAARLAAEHAAVRARG